MFKALARRRADAPRFGLAVVILNLLADAVIIGSLIWGWGIAAAAYGAVALMPVLGLFFNRIDAWPTAAAILAVAAWRRDRPLTLGGAIAIGAAFKLWPIVLAPLLLVPWRERRSIAALAVFGATALAFAGLTLGIAGANGIVQVLTFRGATGWQIESLAGSLVHLEGLADAATGKRRVADRRGSTASRRSRCSSPPRRCARGAAGAARRLDRVGAGWLASVSALLLLSALFSAQYVIWLAPAGAIAWVCGEKRLAMLTRCPIVLTQILWMSYGGVMHSDLPAMLVVVARNAVVVAIAALAIARLRPSRVP